MRDARSSGYIILLDTANFLIHVCTCICKRLEVRCSRSLSTINIGGGK